MKSVLSLVAQNIIKQFSSKPILKGITQTFEQQKTYALMGASGSGKSTFLHILAGLDQPTKGSIYIQNNEISTLSEKQRATMFGTVFQNPFLIKELTVLENIELAGSLAGLSASETSMRAQKLLQVVGLEQTVSWQVGELSGGQQQRVCLARALINRPAFLLADELTGNLDQKTAFKMIHLLIRLQKEWKMGIILTTHNPEIAHMMELVFILKDGNLVAKNNFDR
jgi:ABC-type lipoprotein export system ATPase subunit